jgi:hypothetical protein
LAVGQCRRVEEVDSGSGSIADLGGGHVAGVTEASDVWVARSSDAGVTWQRLGPLNRAAADVPRAAARP